MKTYTVHSGGQMMEFRNKANIGDLFKIFVTKVENGVVFSIYDEHGLLISNVTDSESFIKGLKELIDSETN